MQNARLNLLAGLRKYEEEQKKYGLIKYVSAINKVRWGTSKQIMEWKIIDIDVRNNFVNLRPRQFEKLIANLFNRMGYDTTLTPQTTDYGTDIITNKNGEKIVVEVKKYSINTTVGNREVQRLLGSMYHYNANKAIFVTSSTFTRQAYEQASKAPVELWDRNKLNEMIDRWFLTNSSPNEVQRWLDTDEEKVQKKWESGLNEIQNSTTNKSPFKIWCDCYAPNEAKDPLGEYDRLLLEQGKNHEEKTVSIAYPEAEKLTYSTPEEGFRLALESMRDGITAMNNIPLFFLPEGLLGRADILEKNAGHPSIFGNYHYIIKEIKLAKNIKDYHIIQTAFYNYIIGKIQGYTPDYFVLINRDQEESFCSYSEGKVIDAITGIIEIFNGKTISPTYGSCDWPWETYCNNEAIRTEDISLVSNLGSSFKYKLLNAGFNNVSDLANASINDLTAIKGIGPKRAFGFKTNATALATGNPVKLKDAIFPSVTTEIFLDLEGTGEVITEEGLVSIDYLIGVLVRKDGKEEYIPFIANNLEAEDQMIIDFLDWLDRQEDYMIYHWHHYEKTHLDRLGERHGVTERLSNSLSGRIRDLYKDAVSCFAFPTYGNGLTQVAKFMGFFWRDQNINAMESAALYFKYIENPEENKGLFERVLIYNEDDCIATRIVKDWIVAHCS